MKNFKRFVGHKIRLRREEQNLSQDALAKTLGIDKAQISRWETGKTTPDSVSQGPLADALKVDAETFFDLENNSELLDEHFELLYKIPKITDTSVLRAILTLIGAFFRFGPNKDDRGQGSL